MKPIPSGCSRTRTSTACLASGATELPGLGDRVEGNARGDTGVERLEPGRHRDAHQLVARLGHQPGDALALAADHHHQRTVAELEVGQADVAVRNEADGHESRSLDVLELAGEAG